jgi:hypothetical protein
MYDESSVNIPGNGRAKLWHQKARILTISPALQFFDAKRRILRLSIDPFYSLIATADGLGRVELYDIQGDCFIRLWKGLRDAYLGWHIDEDDVDTATTAHQHNLSPIGEDDIYNSKATRNSLQLAILAPLLGLISLYKMRNGPCLRVIPVGMNCKFVNIFSSFIQDNNR